jgi:L-alanine-DL-glutamate epimerase-like enolase superfamily enzyme
MRIAEIRIEPKRVPILVPYRIAGRTFDTAEMIFVTLVADSGLTGYGSASPVPPLTGDDFETATRVLEHSIAPALRGAEIPNLAEAVGRAEAASGGAKSALAAADIALHDLRAKSLGVPLVRALGGARRRLITSITVGIGDPTAMAESARRHVANGFRCIKVKIGEDPEADLDALRRIRAAVGGDVAIRADANQGYTPDEAIRVGREMERLSIELFEQPVAAGDIPGMKRVTGSQPLPVVADEGVKVAADLVPLIQAGAARGANIKLMKCGGIAEAIRIDAALQAAGWSALVGCMDESRASIAAAAHFGAAAGSAAWIDLDGHVDLAADPFTGGFEIVGGEIVLGDAPGLGVAPGGK